MIGIIRMHSYIGIALISYQILPDSPRTPSQRGKVARQSKTPTAVGVFGNKSDVLHGEARTSFKDEVAASAVR